MPIVLLLNGTETWDRVTTAAAAHRVEELAAVFPLAVVAVEVVFVAAGAAHLAGVEVAALARLDGRRGTLWRVLRTEPRAKLGQLAGVDRAVAGHAPGSVAQFEPSSPSPTQGLYEKTAQTKAFEACAAIATHLRHHCDVQAYSAHYAHIPQWLDDVPALGNVSHPSNARD